MKRQLFSMLLVFISLVVYSQPKDLRVTIVQDKNKYDIVKDTQIIKISKAKFKIVFNSFGYTDLKSYATQIDAFTDAKGISMIHPGVKINDIPYFAGGTGLAGFQSKQYECMYIDTGLGQNHYIIYSEKGKDKRAALESKSGDTLRLSWKIKKYAIDPTKEKSMKKLDSKYLYLVILNDFNLDGIVEEGEYAIVKIEFEDK